MASACPGQIDFPAGQSSSLSLSFAKINGQGARQAIDQLNKK